MEIEKLIKALQDALDKKNAVRVHDSIVRGKVLAARRTLDAAKAWASTRMDARETVYMQHMVLQTLSGIERHEYPDAKWANGDLVPITSEVNELTDLFGWHEITDLAPNDGNRKLLADDSDDVPFVSVKGGFNQGRTFGWGIGFHYTDREVRQQKLGIVNVVQERARVARERSDRDLNDLIANGEAAAGVAGIFNIPNCHVLEPASGKKWDGSAGAASASEIRADFEAMYNAFSSVEGEPDTVVVPRKVLTHLSVTINNSNSSDRSILSFLKEAYPFIKRWEWTKENDTGGDGGVGALLLYRKDPERIRFEVPLRPTPQGTEQRGNRFLVEMRGRYATPIIKRPKSLIRLEKVS